MRGREAHDFDVDQTCLLAGGAHVILVAMGLPFAKDDPQRAALAEMFLKLRQPAQRCFVTHAQQNDIAGLGRFDGAELAHPFAQLPQEVFVCKIERRDFTIRLDSQFIQQAFGIENFRLYVDLYGYSWLG